MSTSSAKHPNKIRSWLINPLWATLFLLPVLSWVSTTTAMDGQAVVKKCFDYMRGEASFAEIEMTVHRPDWERTMNIRVWTEGDKESYCLITAPAKDEGNGTLKKATGMWIFNPKVNQVIKLPPSMMSQSWQGSDFSNNDLAKTDTIKSHYINTIEGVEQKDRHKVYLIKSMPKPGAPVVWGMQTLKIRDDGIMLEQCFYDEDLKPVKTMSMSQIQPLGGKSYPKVWKMEKTDAKNEYTRVEYKSLKFTDSLPSRYFTLTNLRNPRR
jgi:outer membrane lipoprotein-sorting protein